MSGEDRCEQVYVTDCGVEPNSTGCRIPDDGKPYVFVASGCERVNLSDVYGYGIHGEVGEILIEAGK